MVIQWPEIKSPTPIVVFPGPTIVFALTTPVFGVKVGVVVVLVEFNNTETTTIAFVPRVVLVIAGEKEPTKASLVPEFTQLRYDPRCKPS